MSCHDPNDLGAQLQWTAGDNTYYTNQPVVIATNLAPLAFGAGELAAPLLDGFFTAGEATAATTVQAASATAENGIGVAALEDWEAGAGAAARLAARDTAWENDNPLAQVTIKELLATHLETISPTRLETRDAVSLPRFTRKHLSAGDSSILR